MVSGYLVLTRFQLTITWTSNMKEVKTVCLGQSIIWSMAAVPKLHNSIVAVRMHPGAIPLAMITMRKSIHGFPLLWFNF